MKGVLSIVLVLLGINPARTQVIETNYLDHANRFPITKYASSLRTLKPISIDSVLKMEAQFEKPEDKSVLVYNYDPYYYWFRFVVESQKQWDLMLLMAPIGLMDGKLFQKKEGRWQQVAHSGLRYKFSNRSYQFTHYTFPFSLLAMTQDTLYLSINANNAYKSFGFALFKPNDLMLFENKIYFVFGIIEGLLILFFILNVSLFFVLKENLNLWYALYIALLFLIVMKNDQLDQQFLSLDSERAFRLTPYMSIGALAIAILLHVVQNFLKETLVLSKKLYYSSTILKINVLLSALLHALVFYFSGNYIVESFVFGWAKQSTLLCIIMIIIDCVYCMKKGNKGALFLLLGTLVFMIGSVQRLFFPSTLSFLFPPTTFHVGIIAEVVVISLGLLFRYRMERKQHWERVDQERKRNELIKKEVAERTAHNLSVELHDTINPDLSLAKINLHTISSLIYHEPVRILLIQEKIKDSLVILSNSINGLRDLSRTLKYVVPIGVEIDEEVNILCQKYSTSSLQVHFVLLGAIIQLEIEKRAMLVKIIKEALQNAVKHAGASLIFVQMSFNEKGMELSVKDNGIGFNIEAVIKTANGLNNIKNHCKLMSATCNIKSSIGGGTSVVVCLPLR